jgi:hypothetical protein
MAQENKKAKFDDGSSFDDDKEEAKAKKDSEAKAKDDDENKLRKEEPKKVGMVPDMKLPIPAPAKVEPKRVDAPEPPPAPPSGPIYLPDANMVWNFTKS